MLTRSNKHYVSQNSSRHKIFLKVIEELREHIMVVRRADSLREQLDSLEHLKKPLQLTFKVSGEISGECRIRALKLSDVRDSSSGAVEMDELWAETKHQAMDEGWVLES